VLVAGTKHISAIISLAQAQHGTCIGYGVSTSVFGVWPMYTAGIDVGQLIHVLYPLGDLICTTFNSTPSEELSFHLSYCYAFAAGAAWDMYRIWRIHIGVWPMYTAGIDVGQLIHVLYPLGDLICATFNSTPSEELTFHLSHCYFAAGAA
jgi:hypothetical protein